jgi:phosphatidate cytidylyltransferase
LNKLVTRTITGIVLVLVMLTAIIASPYSYALLFLIILIVGITEYSNLFKDSEVKPNIALSYGISVVIFAISFLIAQRILGANYLFSVFPMILVVIAAELYRNKGKPLENIAATIFSITYLAMPLALINFLVFPEILPGNSYSPKILIALFSLIWIYDSGAYLVGVSIGKHRLFERISPKKSWEGAIGGTLIAIAAGYFIAGFIPEIKTIHWIAISILTVVSSTFGDLSESMLKRYFGIKDSGTILPGHGGVLDRFDSLFFAVPVVVMYLKLFVE